MSDLNLTVDDCDLTLVVDTGADCECSGSRISIYTNETRKICKQLNDCNCDQLDLDGTSLVFRVWNRRRKVVIDEVATGTATGFCVTIPKQPKQDPNAEWSVRMADTGEVLGSGLFEVRGRP